MKSKFYHNRSLFDKVKDAKLMHVEVSFRQHRLSDSMFFEQVFVQVSFDGEGCFIAKVALERLDPARG